MHEVPADNTQKILVDVKDPATSYASLAEHRRVDLRALVLGKNNRARRVVHFSAATGLISFAAIILVFFLGFRDAASIASEKSEKIAANISRSMGALSSVDAIGAAAALKDNEAELESLETIIYKNKNSNLFGGIGSIFPVLKDAASMLKDLAAFNALLLALTQKIDDLKKNGFTYLRHDGEALIKRFSEAKVLIDEVVETSSRMKNAAARLETFSKSFGKFNEALGAGYVKHTADFRSASAALETLLARLTDSKPAHILVLFENPAELRPGGGFVGSFADVTLKRGKITSISVEDIAVPDRTENLTRKIVPPVELQKVASRWGARDANWFFDFPTSARTIMNILESSKPFKEKEIAFEGVIVVNTRVVESVLEITGPIKLETPNLLVSNENFEKALQHEIETSRTVKPGENPKVIIGTLLPLLLDRAETLSPEKRALLGSALVAHTTRKDIMVAAKDERLGNTLRALGLDGAVYALPHDFWGSYLAVVNANVGGEKTDAVTNQAVTGRVDVGTDGGSFVEINLTRIHAGDKEKDAWYRAENKNFVQFFINDNAVPVAVEGVSKTARSEKVEHADHEEIPELAAIEKSKIYLANLDITTAKAFGKTVIGAWLNTAAGKSRTLKLKYQIRGNERFALSPERPYRFIFEKQSGARGPVKITLAAPLGYVWRESSAPTYVFEREEPLGREIVELHLVKR